MIHDLLRDPLEDGGYQVVSATTGEDAVSLLEDDEHTWQALITDVNLGPKRLTGWEVARRARELNPTLPVIYMTGDSTHEWAAQGVPNSVLLAKPFAPAQVVTAISQLLNDAVQILPPSRPD